MKKDLYSCDKCSHPLGVVNTFTEMGECFYFCNVCASILDKLPDGSVQKFLNDDADISEEDRSIINARIRRSKGERLWT